MWRRFVPRELWRGGCGRPPEVDDQLSSPFDNILADEREVAAVFVDDVVVGDAEDQAAGVGHQAFDQRGYDVTVGKNQRPTIGDEQAEGEAFLRLVVRQEGRHGSQPQTILRVLDERRHLQVLDAIGQSADVPQIDRYLHDSADHLTLEGEPASDLRFSREGVFVGSLLRAV